MLSEGLTMADSTFKTSWLTEGSSFCSQTYTIKKCHHVHLLCQPRMKEKEKKRKKNSILRWRDLVCSAFCAFSQCWILLFINNFKSIILTCKQILLSKSNYFWHSSNIKNISKWVYTSNIDMQMSENVIIYKTIFPLVILQFLSVPQ